MAVRDMMAMSIDESIGVFAAGLAGSTLSLTRHERGRRAMEEARRAFSRLTSNLLTHLASSMVEYLQLEFLIKLRPPSLLALWAMRCFEFHGDRQPVTLAVRDPPKTVSEDLRVLDPKMMPHLSDIPELLQSSSTTPFHYLIFIYSWIGWCDGQHEVR